MKTVTKTELAQAVTNSTGLQASEARDLVDQVLEEIKSGLARDGKVLLSGFGCFQTRDKSERQARNPKTMEPATVSARRVVTFTASTGLKQRVNGEE